MVIILDGVGCGELPDAGEYNDIGSNTLGNTAEAVGGMDLPALQEFGLGNIIPIKGVPPADKPSACFGKMAERSPAKDSTVGHWELMCCPVEKAPPTYPEGFPRYIVNELENRTGYRFIGNCPASGTKIIADLGQEHLDTGALILYTSADSVLQIAAHEEEIPVAELYRVCQIAREIMTDEHGVGRIIARPFAGSNGNFTRTTRRHDFSLEAPADTMLDILHRSGIKTISVGKIFDLFGSRGLSQSNPTSSNQEGIEMTISVCRDNENAFVFTNLVDFDMLWGHRNDPQKFYRGLKEFDRSFASIIDSLNESDLIIITADHGVDPTTESTDHSREYVPVLAKIIGSEKGVSLGTRSSFADAGATVGDYFEVRASNGVSFLHLLT